MLLWRDLTKVVSIQSRGPRTDVSRLGIELGPLAWEASTLEKSHPDSLLIAIQNIYSTYEPATWLPPVHVLHEHT
jgi:hypothetical protein